jgi:hypothetical protein
MALPAGWRNTRAGAGRATATPLHSSQAALNSLAAHALRHDRGGVSQQWNSGLRKIKYPVAAIDTIKP